MIRAFILRWLRVPCAHFGGQMPDGRTRWCDKEFGHSDSHTYEWGAPAAERAEAARAGIRRVSRCGKRGYRDELAAKIALATTGRRRRPNAKDERRAYPCPCGRWHLTSRGRKPRPSATVAA